jgi:RNA polymerase sigma-70 factor (ECF subfamily)
MREQRRKPIAGPDPAASFPIANLIAQRETFLRFIEKRVNDRAAAEDILQAAYIRVMDQAHSLRNEKAADAWFYRILSNAVIDFYRHRSVVNRIVESLEEGIEPVAHTRDNANICPCLIEVLNDLRPAYAEVLREVDLAEESAGALNGFAKRSGITAGTAAVRSHRAKKALEKRLRHTCGSCAGTGCFNCNCRPAVTHQG